MRAGCGACRAALAFGADCLWAFGVGGGICLLGEVLRQSYLAMGWKPTLPVP